MSTANAAAYCGPAARADSNVSRIAVVRASAASIVMEPSGQLTLALTTGYHVGPLFIVRKRRAPVIHGGTLGGKRRRQREKRNTPKWADMKAIRSMYRQAELMTKATGELYVVDHIVPLDGKLVCGLHWHVNMRVIHWLANSKKGWGTWPDMPFDQLELL